MLLEPISETSNEFVYRVSTADLAQMTSPAAVAAAAAASATSASSIAINSTNPRPRISKRQCRIPFNLACIIDSRLDRESVDKALLPNIFGDNIPRRSMVYIRKSTNFLAGISRYDINAAASVISLRVRQECRDAPTCPAQQNAWVMMFLVSGSDAQLRTEVMESDALSLKAEQDWKVVVLPFGDIIDENAYTTVASLSPTNSSQRLIFSSDAASLERPQRAIQRALRGACPPPVVTGVPISSPASPRPAATGKPAPTGKAQASGKQGQASGKQGQTRNNKNSKQNSKGKNNKRGNSSNQNKKKSSRSRKL